MVRYVAKYDHDEAQRVLDWPLTDMLERHLFLLREDAMKKYELAVKVWATLTPHQDPGSRKKPPNMPRILKEPGDA